MDARRRAHPSGSRLISRWRLDQAKGVGTFLWTAIADPGAFLMERKMLLRLKAFAEAARRPVALPLR